MTIEKGTIEARLELLEIETMAHGFVLWQMARLLASSASSPEQVAAKLRTECDEHFASLPGDPTEHQDFQQVVENILDNAFGTGNEDFTARSPKAGG